MDVVGDGFLDFGEAAIEPKAKNIAPLLGYLSGSTLVDAESVSGQECEFLPPDKLISSPKYQSQLFVNQEGEIVGGTEIKTPADNRLRWDFIIKIENDIFAFEFDGPDHYQFPRKIRSDNRKDEQASKAGYKSIRWPYWVQADSNTIKHYFGITADVRTKFPHGFKGGTTFFPSCFCEMGVSRFRDELTSLPEPVRADVAESLRVMAEKEGGDEWVVPLQVKNLF